MVVMRRFLDPGADLYYLGAWNKIRERCIDALGQPYASQIDLEISRIRQGQLSISVDTRRHNAASVYEMVASGSYFRADASSSEALDQLGIMRPLADFVFYQYATDCMGLLSSLYEGINALVSDSGGSSEATCLFCQETNKPFTMWEHIFPESLGNHELVLEPGVVCDDCNNEFHKLDEALINFAPIALARVQFVPHTKDGKLPEAVFANARLFRDSPRNIVIRPQGKRVIVDTGERPDGLAKFRLNLRGRKVDPTSVARALYKICLELLALEWGTDFAKDPRFDQARKFVLKGGAPPNDLVMSKNAKLEGRCLASYIPSAVGSLFAVSIYGIVFLLNLESDPPIREVVSSLPVWEHEYLVQAVTDRS
jgi:hypothetical protein